MGEVADIAAGRAVLGFMVFFPLALVLLFGILFALRQKIEKRRLNSHVETVIKYLKKNR